MDTSVAAPRNALDRRAFEEDAFGSMRRAWIVLGVVSVLVVVLAALYVFNTNLTGVTVEGSGGRRTIRFVAGRRPA